MKLDTPNFGRKTPPPFADLQIRDLAAQGFSKLGIAARFQVSLHIFNNWLDADDTLQQAFKKAHRKNLLSMSQVYHLAGHVMQVTGNSEAAREYFSKAVQLNPHGRIGQMAQQALDQMT